MLHPKQKRVSRCKYKMPIRPQAAERRAQEKARKQQAAAETKTDKENGRESAARAAKERRVRKGSQRTESP